jgi:hypothetical protein
VQAISALGLQIEQDEEFKEEVITLKGTDAAYWTPNKDSTLPVSLQPWGAPLEALFKDEFGAVKTMALFSAIKLADGAYGQFQPPQSTTGKRN